MLDVPPTQIFANDFGRQWKDVRDDALAAVDRVGYSGRLILGDEVSGFEREVADWWGVPYAVGVASGLDALEITLRCLGVGAGTRVVTTPLTAFATTLAILRAGAEPVWCDVDSSGGLDLGQVSEVLRTDRLVRAVLPVHLYGHPLDPDGLTELADTYGVAVIEDCAQSAGASRNGRPTGLAGVAGATSLYPTKNLGAMGDGGLVLTKDWNLAERARCLRDYGQAKRYEHVEAGLNSRLDELQAAVLRSALLPRLDGWILRRRQIAERYRLALQGSRLRPVDPQDGLSSYHLFAVEVMDGAALAVSDELARRGVATGRHYPFVCPDQAAARGVGVSAGDLPVARGLAERELSLPIHPYLTDEEVGLVIEACLDACR